MERRELFKILAAGAVATPATLAQHQHVSASLDPASYQPRFFSQAQYQAVDRLCDIVIPSDEQSPGAHAAGVAFYVDTVLHHGDDPAQRIWRDGLEEVERAARSRFSRGFLECSRADQETIVAMMARNEATPDSELEKFFGVLKRMAVEAYTLSDVGMHQYLGYKGDAVLSNFPGCTHAEHQS